MSSRFKKTLNALTSALTTAMVVLGVVLSFAYAAPPALLAGGGIPGRGERFVSPTDGDDSWLIDAPDLRAPSILPPAPAAMAGLAGASDISITDIESTTLGSMNYLETTTHSVTVTGDVVAIGEGVGDNAIFATYSGRKDIAEFHITAREVIVRSPLRLPQSNVSITAEVLRFEDDDPEAPAQIITTPTIITTRPGKGVSGRHGLRAGDITINSRVVCADYDSLRFILDGGNGEPAGLGIDGVDGRSVNYTGVYLACYGRQFDQVVEYSYYDSCVDPPASHGFNYGRPSSGSDAASPGLPGDGGDGGVFTSTRNAAGLARADGGNCGEKAPNARGGRAGTPTAPWTLYEGRFFLIAAGGCYPECEASGGYISGGRDAPAPDAAKPVGNPGTITFLEINGTGFMFY